MMRFGVLTHALRVPIEDAPAAAARAGFDGLEWSVRGEPPDDPFWSAHVRRAVAQRASDAGVTFASIHLHTGSHPDFPDDADGRNREKSVVLEAIDYAAALGAGVVVLPSFVQRLLATPPEHIQRAAEDLRAWAPAAEAANVTIGIEDVLTAEQNVALIDAIGSPAVKIYYDLGNSLRFGLDPYTGVELLGHRICQHHMKDAAANPPVDANGF
ncbi:MAG: sugar phosphate isomerase/epimerase, partial [Actinobacteria bacterium]|nr:sugar phosphate isomerase/epimerase [Actinomycetota bacterium]